MTVPFRRYFEQLLLGRSAADNNVTTPNVAVAGWMRPDPARPTARFNCTLAHRTLPWDCYLKEASYETTSTAAGRLAVWSWNDHGPNSYQNFDPLGVCGDSPHAQPCDLDISVPSPGHPSFWHDRTSSQGMDPSKPLESP